MEPVLAEHRPKGALWSWMAVPGGFHGRLGQEVLSVPMLDAAVRVRYPRDGGVLRGPLTLKRLDPGAGWIADNTKWHSGLTAIAPAADFKGNVARSSWLPIEDIACIYRAYSTFDRPLRILSPKTSADAAVDAGARVSLRIDDARFAGWTKLDLLDGAVRVGELSRGPAQLRVDNLKAGFHAFSVLGTDRSGNVRPSNPVLVVVRG